MQQYFHIYFAALSLSVFVCAAFCFLCPRVRSIVSVCMIIYVQYANDYAPIGWVFPFAWFMDRGEGR